ncbi:hypothetical protein MoryE10_15640 [Methylogaea oryzae]|uniref:Carrier domain-containing protein n=1 Tax=Methylogaea oryzae TaxID=1295382 RepID=A0A8D4VML1_9GAMM|nr:hypothetical protein MoryE10_15640 [Methylogaea oryzae]
MGIVGILKSGGAYVPLDPAYPPDRLAFMAEDARLAVVVAGSGGPTNPDSPDETPWNRGCTLLYLDAGEADLSETDDQAPPELAGPANLAYAIYTSGSTGRPKGVLVEHRQVLRLFTSCTPWFRFGSDDVWTLFHSYAFDFSVWEFWGALLFGGRLVVVPHATSRSPAAFFQLLRQEGVTMLNQTPSAFRQLVAVLPDGKEAELPALRWIVFAGEAIDLPSVRAWMERYGDSQPLLVNMYGITETTVHSTYRAMRREDLESASVSPIGRPLADLTIHLLDSRLKPVPIGVQGEIYVGGDGVTRGYLNRPELTDQRFIADPFEPTPGARLYKSGDLARWRSDGELEYLGRGDHQVKIRGFRIELGEIEALLNQHPGLAASLVTVFHTDGDARLAAYVVAKPGESVSVDALRDLCRQCLPQYMVPAAFVVLDSFPLTPSGKIDRRALPAPGAERPELGRTYTPPETPAETLLAEVWAEALKLERVGIDDNFFDLGGDSILSIQVVSKAAQRGLAFGLTELFQHQSVRQLAAVARTAQLEIAPAYQPYSLLSPEQRARLPEDVEDAYPLAALQAGMIFHSELDEQSVSYHDLLSLYLQAPYDPAALAAALARLAARHPLLRTSFDLSAAGEPIQRVHRRAEIPLIEEDWRALDEDAQEQALAQWIGEEQRRPFDWKTAPLARVFLRRRGEDRFELSLSVHHAVLDGWSAATFYTGMLRDYLSRCSPDATQRDPDHADAAAPAPYAEFIALERQTLADEAAWAYWQRQLDGALFTPLPRLAAPGSNPDLDRAWPVPIGADISDALKQLAKQAGVPLKSLLLTAHVYALGRLTGHSDITTGLVANGRPETPGGEKTLGLFLNTVPFRHRLAAVPWLEGVRAVAAQERELLPQRRFPLAEMQRRHGGELFETAFNFIHFHVLKDAIADPALHVLRERGFARTNLPLAAEFSLDVNRNDAVTLRLSVHSDAIDDRQLATMADIYRRTLESLALAPQVVPDARHILPPREWQRVTRDFALGESRPVPELPAHAMVAAQAASQPDAVALIAGGEEVSYAELETRAERLAKHLADHDIQAESLVGVALPRGIDAVVAVLAVLKAGGAYLPLDISYPAERLAYMLEDARPALLLSHSGVELPEWDGPVVYVDAHIGWARASLPATAHDRQPADGGQPIGRPPYLPEDSPEAHGARAAAQQFAENAAELPLPQGEGWGEGKSKATALKFLHPEGEETEAAAFGQPPCASPVAPNQLAYVIYTSGSTGKPKGVLVEHRGLSNLVQAQGEAFDVHPGDRVLQFARLGFDASVSEIFVTLGRGATLVLAPPGELLAGAELSRLLREQRISVATLPPSALATLPDTDLPELHTLVVAGEACPAPLVQRWARGRRFLNAYGPTEGTVCASIAACNGDSAAPPIGRPMANTQVYVLDEQGQPLPVGAAGEIHIGGVGLARGYLNRPELTEERFVSAAFEAHLEPLSPQGRGVGERGGVGEKAAARLYRSGDLGRWRADGQLEFLGRLDEQVKLRGYRIELGEIEARLLEHPAIRECLVLLREDSGAARLAAYVSGNGPLPELSELHRHLRAFLPDYMVPAEFQVLDALPRDAHGKFDRRALAGMGGRSLQGGAYLAPVTPTQTALAAIWSEVLRVERVGLRDNFFELGGDSILSIQLVSKVRDAGFKLSAKQLFEHPNIESLSAAIDAGGDEQPQQAGTAEALLPPALAAQLARRYPGYQDAYPLAPLQQGLLFESLYAEQDEAVYFEQPRLFLRGELDGERLRQAFRQVLQRHDALRAAVVHQGLDAPLQVICREIELPWRELDWRDAADFEARLERFLAEDRADRFDFEQAPLLRLALLRRTDSDWVLVFSNHHLLLDGWSLPIVLGEAFALYRDAKAALPPVRPYRDYLGWLAGRDREAAENYWRAQLAGCDAPAGPDLPQPRQPQPGHSDVRAVLDAPLYADLQAYARRRGLTLSSLCLGAWALLLARYSRSEEVLFGVTVSGRPPELAGVERMVGLFINTVPVRLAVDEEQPLSAWLAALQAQQAEAREHAYLPLSDIRRLGGASAGQAWFDSLLIFENYPVDSSIAGDDGLALTGAAADERTHYPLTLLFMPGEALELRLTYDRSRFESDAMARLADHLRCLLQAMAATPEARLRDLDHLPALERRQVCVDFNATAAPLPQTSCLHQGFERQAQAAPDAVAFIDGTRRITYRELDERANQLARHLQTLGVGPEVPVGLYSRRCADLALAILGILKAGGAYVPLDPEYPKARIRYILEQAKPALVLTQAALAGELPDDARILRLDGDWPSVAEYSAEPLPSRVTGDNLAYVLYTSGSTGQPKGVAVEHRSGAAFMGWIGSAFRAEELAGVLFSTSVCFDLSVFELFAPWWHGGAAILANHALEFFDLPARDEVSLINTVPSAMAGLLNLGELPAGVLTIGMGGEALPDELARRIYRQPHRPRLLNLYGPTEDTVYSAWGIGDPASGRAPDIGRPIANSRAYVLDALLRPQALGVPGELYLGGAGLARGYLHRQDLTDERFVADPFDAGARLYRTGDLCRWRPDGQLEYLGRLDHQVKLRGFRIELGEIEAVLRAHPQVRDGAVIARSDAGSPRLVAYVVAQTGSAPLPHELHEHLAASLPEYMLPAAWVFLDALPLTPNGKLDRRALPTPAMDTADSQADAAPRNACEDILCAIWAAALARPSVGIHDDFFALGGDSILAIQVVGKARQAGWQFSVRQLFQHPTVAGLAQQAAPVAAHASVLSADAPPSLTPIQHWFFAQRQPEPHHFNQALLLETREPLATERLERAMRHLLHHHDALRQRFRFEGETVHVEYAADDAPLCAGLDLSAVADADLPAAIETAANQAQRELDLSNGPLLRLLHMDLGADRPGRLLLVVHHLAVDWVSWWILLDDLVRVYDQLQQALTPQLPAKTLAYRDWAAYLAQQARAAENELDFWRDRAVSPSPPPLDFPGGDNSVASSHELEISLSEEETRSLLQAVPEAYRTHIDDVLLTALAQAYAAWSGQPALQLDLESHGREDFDGALDLSRSVGWFTCLYPVRLELPGGDAGEALKSVKEQLRRIPRRGLGWGLLRYLHPDPALRAELAALPASPISFNYLGQSDQSLPSSSLFAYAKESVGLSHSPLRRRACPIEVNGYVAGGRFHCRFMYSDNLHREATVLALAERFIAALRGLLAHCTAEGAGGRTPSDFPLARLSQAEVDRLAGNGAEVEDIYPLSPMQQGLLFHSLGQPGGGLYLEQLVLELEGELDRRKLHAAWQTLLQRHPALRSALAWEALSQPLQIVQRRPVLPWREVDWRDAAAEEQSARLEALLREDRKAGFHLSSCRAHGERGNDVMLRLTLIRLSQQRWQLLWTHHHLLLDGWSRSILLKELFELYGGGSPPPAPRPFRDYLAWLQSRDAAQAENHWRQVLAGVDAATPLPLADAAAAAPDDGAPSAIAERCLSPQNAAALERFARGHGLTWSTLARGAWALLLGSHAGADEVLFGATVSGRPAALAGVENMVGMFVNTLPVRIGLPADGVVLPWLQNLQAQQAEDGAFEYASLAEIQAWSGLEAGRALFETLLVVENYPVDALDEADLPLRIAGLQSRERSNLPLVALLLPGASPSLHLSYDPARYSNADAARLLEQWEHRLLSLIARPDARLGELDPLTAAEKQTLLRDWNHTAAAYPDDCCVHDLIQRQAALTPAAEALRFRGESMSYAELEARAGGLAQRLHALGIGPESRVGLCAARSMEMVVGLLAILKAGGAYVPLDPAYPAERLRYMIEDADLALLLVQPELREALPDTATLRLDLAMPAPAETAALPAPAVGPANAAYVIYTSGTTGRPKGVVLEHRGACNLALAQQRAFGVTVGTRVLQFASLSFDAATWEILMALCAGGTLCLAPAEDLLPGLELARFLREQDIHIATLPPSALAAMAAEALPALATLIVAGEACPAELVDRWAVGRRFFNAYGPTETTVCAAWSECEAGQGRPSIGRPIANTRLYLLDGRRRPVPQGAVGELYVGGAGVARGYLNQPELTAERYVDDPFSDRPGARLYRTGDLCRWRADGRLDFLGRADHQVKIRGYRIEPGEIESQLLRQSGVAEAAVIGRDEPGGTRLVAYVAPEPGTHLNVEKLRDALRETLPAYMLPSAWVLVPALPLTPNGKLDRRALPAPERLAEAPATAFDPAAALIADVFASVLGLERAAATDDFFELGGHSLLATQVQWRLRELFQVELPLRALFEYPTPAALAQHLEALRRDGADAPPPLLPRDGEQRRVPLSFAQERLYFLDRLEPGSAFYNSAVALRLHGPLERTALLGALRRILERHEVLRTCFPAPQGEPCQAIAAEAAVAWEEIDLGDWPDADRAQELHRRLQAASQRPFDLAQGPLARFSLIRLDDRQHALLAAFHHSVFDGWSVGVLLRELAQGYQSHRHDASLPAALPLQYADFALWQRDWLQGAVLERELGYWRGRLAGAEPLQLPTDRPRPALQTYNGDRVALALPPDLMRALTALGRERGATLFMTLLAAFKVLLYRYSGQDDIVVGTPVAGRNRAELENLIGCFINLLPLRTDLSDAPDFRTLLARIRHATLEAFAHQAVPFEKLVESLAPARDPSRSPLFQVLFTLQNLPAPTAEFGGLRLEPIALESEHAQYDLSLTLNETPDGWQGELEYNADLFLPATAQRLARHWLHLLQAIAADPGCAVDRLPLLDEGERRRMLELGKGPAFPSHSDSASPLPGGERSEGLEAGTLGRLESSPIALHRLFEAQAQRTPNAVAVTDGRQSWRYAELDARADQLAQRLAALGLEPGATVALRLERSPELVMAMLAVLKAGGAYLPLDPAYPPQRLAWMLEDSGAAILIEAESPESPASRPPANLALTVRRLAANGEATTSSAGGQDASAPGLARQPAYLIYTSGSTGTPKAVQVPHAALLNHAGWAVRCYQLRPDDKVLQFASASFDVAAEEIFPTLLAGATLVLRDDDALAPDRFGAWVESRGITLLNLPTAFWHTWTRWLATSGATLPRTLRLLVVGGEKASKSAYADWRRVAGAERVRWLNAYGPTETTVTATVYDPAASPPLHEDDELPIGLPVDNATAYVLDSHRQPLPKGAPGELYIGGSGVALGYLRRPELTAAAFVADPHVGDPAARMFKTGDRCRWRADGQLEYLGRCDQQVKIRGYRIEPGEIEAVLARHPAVAAAVVTARADDGGEAGLVAYLVASQRQPADFDPRLYLQGQLPDYMLPAAFVWLETLPHTPSGKIDRKALPAPDLAAGRDAATFLPPRDAVEQGLAEIWSELLGVETVGIRDDFFALGGHSLLAMRAVALIAQRFGRSLPLASLFQTATVEAVARQLRSPQPTAAQQEQRSRPALFCVAPPPADGLCYAALARHLGPDRPFHALASIDQNNEPADATDLAAIAAGQLSALRAAQPKGPYLLGGWSLGGLITFEMARQLRAAGEEVRQLILLDCLAPGADPNPYRPPQDAAELLAQFCAGLGLPAGPARWSGVDQAERLQGAAEALLQAGLVPPDFDAAQLQRRLSGYAALLDAAWRYAPEPCALDITLLRAEAVPEGPGLPDLLRDEAMGWNRYCLRPVAVQRVPGDHLSMLREPLAAQLAERLRALLERETTADQAYPGTARGTE